MSSPLAPLKNKRHFQLLKVGTSDQPELDWSDGLILPIKKQSEQTIGQNQSDKGEALKKRGQEQSFIFFRGKEKNKTYI